jgi:hypothetical protein
MIKLYPPTLGGPAREDNSELEEHIKVILSIFDAGKYRKKSKDCLALRQHNEDYSKDPRLIYLEELFQKKYNSLEEIKNDLRDRGLCKLAEELSLNGLFKRRKITYHVQYNYPQTFAIVAEIE